MELRLVTEPLLTDCPGRNLERAPPFHQRDKNANPGFTIYA